MAAAGPARCRGRPREATRRRPQAETNAESRAWVEDGAEAESWASDGAEAGARANAALPVEEWAAQQVRRWEAGSAGARADAEQKLEEYFSDFPQMREELRPVQLEGVISCISRGGKCLLADEMGVGKSLQALVISHVFAERWPLLIVAPAGIVLNWRMEVAKWLPHFGDDDVQVLTTGKQQVNHDSVITILSYNLLVSNEAFRRRPDGQPYEVVIVDEAHALKTPEAMRTKALLPICKKATLCTLLTGTPVLNRAAEVFTLLTAVMPSMPSFERFCERYSEVRYIDGERVNDGVKHPEELHRLLKTVMVRRRKAEGLPELGRKQRQVEIIPSDRLDHKCRRRILALDRTAMTSDKYMPMVFSLTGRAKAKAVADYVEDLLVTETKVVVFGHHHFLLDAVERRVKASRVGYIRIDGRVPLSLRETRVEQFQSTAEVSVALVGITACGQGISLTAARVAVFGELHWVPAKLLQAEDRLHRHGQESNVEIHYCVAEGYPFMDDAIITTIDKKEKLMDDIVEGRPEPSRFGVLRKTPAPDEGSPPPGRGKRR